MTDKQDVIVSLLKEIDKNIENLGGSETDVLLSNRITTLENSVKTINTDINGIKTTNTTQTTNITSNTNKINTTNTNVSNLTTRVTNVENKATTNESNINTLNERVTTLETTAPSGGGGSTTSGGYPIKVVDTTESPGISLDPNTFYQVPGSGAIFVFSSDAEYYNQSGQYVVLQADTDNSLLVAALLSGGFLIEDNSIEGYSYKLIVNLIQFQITIYFTDNPTTTAVCNVYILPIDLGGNLMPEFRGELQNIVQLNNTGYIYQVKMNNFVPVNTWFILQEENSVDGKYTYFPTHAMLEDLGVVTTDVPIEEATKLYLVDETAIEQFGTELDLFKIPSQQKITETCEYVYQVHTPFTAQMFQNVYWNNDTPPDLTVPGILTVSIVGGHACYTFKPM